MALVEEPAPPSSPGDDDAYDDLEDWYSSSFPRLGSTASVTANELSAMSNDERDDAMEAMGSPDDYEIVLDAEETARSVGSTRADDAAVAISFAVEPVPDLPHPVVPLTLTPKKLFSPPSDVLPMSCDRCRSDLNRKLLVRCSACGFCRHLYCFSPPLRQHPALVVLPKLARHARPPISALIARWRCDACVQSLSAVDAKPREAKSDVSPGRKSAWSPTKAPRKAGKKSSPTRSPPKRSVSPERTTGPTQKQPFNWHRFRAEKAARVLGDVTMSTVDDDDDDGDDQRAEQDPALARSPLHRQLAFYSPTVTLMKKTAVFWQWHVRQRQRHRERLQATELRLRVPPKRNVMVSLDAREREIFRVEQEQRQRRIEAEQQEDLALFDDALVYRFDDPRPIFETLRRRPVVVTPVGEPGEQEGDTASSKGELNAAEQQRQDFEAQMMALEDDDAPTPEQAKRWRARRSTAMAMAAAAGVDLDADPGVVGLYLAAHIINRATLGWRWRCEGRKQREIERERRRAEEERQQQRRSRAQSNVLTLVYCVQFVLLMFRKMRQVQLKKELLLVLQDAAEDTSVTASAEDPEIARRQLAEKRIQRFFLRHVRRYVRLKKTMMVRRLWRWWRHKFLPYKWRMAAIEVRHRHRTRAAMKMQHWFRRWRLYRAVRLEQERHAIRKVRTFLRGWLIRRLARREKERLAVYHAALSLGIASHELRERPEASIVEIVERIGMAAYENGDFWYAAAMLERVYRRRSADGRGVDTELRLALAYSHHMAWHQSCDAFNLTRAHDLYCDVLDSLSVRASKDAASVVDPFILQDLAIVLMQRAAFVASLRLLAKLIEFFSSDDAFPLWLLLAGVQLQQLGRWEQSVEYLTYVSDLVLPAPYVERDVLALCAISCDLSRSGGARDAWKAACRLWFRDKRLQVIAAHDSSYLSALSGNGKSDRQSTQRKWELLVDLAQRAINEGHYLIACRALLYAVERVAPADLLESQDDPAAAAVWQAETRRVWWLLGDAFRHLGQLELYVEATARSQDHETTDDERHQWRTHAEQQAHCFEHDLTALSTRQHVEQMAQSYGQSTATYAEQDVTLEDV
ncbi:hypothetical protein ATCC90586_006568 [Pythium insidiosum]|nr:hypothetical protein ATCC90586_006568 [Pythium insidiosum]